MIRHADEAMFRAKQAGRDQIVVAEPDPEPGASPLRPVASFTPSG